jgi:hypothetical protein
MTTGLLGTANLSAATNTTVCTLPAGSQAFTINICNRNTTNVVVRVAPMSTTGTPAVSEWFVFDDTILANKTMQVSGIVSGSANNVVVYSDTANVSVNVYGV